VLAFVVSAEAAAVGGSLPERVRRRWTGRERAFTAGVPVLSMTAVPDAVEGSVDIVTGGRLAVVGTTPSAGRSRVALQVAEAMAARGRSVVLVDADLRDASLHERLEAPRAPGLAELLGRSATRRRTAASALTPVEGGVRFLAAGDPVADPTAVLSVSSVRGVLDAIDADIVVLDAPASPLETAALVRASGAFLLVAPDRAASRQDRRLVEVLRAAGATAVGVVVAPTDEPAAVAAVDEPVLALP
jgi:Mrp family chromosome partitioning ATPase